MATTKKETRYSTLSPVEELDLENDSDSTLASSGFLGKGASQNRRRPSKSSNAQRVLVWLRWGSIVILQGIIVLLLLWRRSEDEAWSQVDTETGGDINGLYVPRSHTYTLLTPEMDQFVPNMTTDANRMEIRKNWDMLMPLGSGTVRIPDYTQHPMLGKPINDDPIRGGPIFEASWTHALHCLYYTVDNYHQQVLSNGQKFGFDGERNDAHASHCFEYLRNQLMCMMDMTLEGSESLLDATGMGQPHMCRNRDEAVAWIEERRADDIRSIVGP